jgi:hypothetical protein
VFFVCFFEAIGFYAKMIRFRWETCMLGQIEYFRGGRGTCTGGRGTCTGTKTDGNTKKLSSV